MKKEIKDNLKELGFNENEIRIYITLTELGEAKASEIAKKSDLPRTTAISILEKLKNEGYITIHQYKGVAYYWIESPKIIANVFNHKTEVAGNLSNLLADLYRNEANFPSSHVYDTKTGIKNFIEKTLANLEKKSIIYTIDTPNEGNYSKIFSDTVENNIKSIKTKRGLLTYTLIPFGSYKDIAEEKIKSQSIKIRELPKDLNFKSSIWIIKDLVVFFSGNPPFLTAIKHKSIFQGIRGIFDFLWNISEPKN